MHRLPFEGDTDAFGHVMGARLLQGGKLISYHFKLFFSVVLNYPTYDKELYDLVQVIKNKSYFLCISKSR